MRIAPGLPAWMMFSSLVLAAPARAQTASLEGTYIDYVAVGEYGTMLATTTTGESCADTFSCTVGSCDFGTFECGETRSMRFHESPTGTPSCDAFFPGSPVETFTVEYVTAGGLRDLVTNQFGAGQFVPTSGPTASGREIRWTGSFDGGSGVALSIEQVHAYEADDNYVRLTVVLTNTGTVGLTDVYYMRNADPDHGSCGIGGDTGTVNDVRRQPPTFDSALVTAGGGDRTSPDRYAVLGIGSHDDRARANASGFFNTEAASLWMMPGDPEGANGDIGVDLIFREPSGLAPGDSLTFEILYVWGPSEAEVEMRFDAVGAPTSPCGSLADGAACDVRGRAGICRAARCCTGCWDGVRCLSGSASACGIGGAACVSCADGDLCTSDVCTLGACTHPDAPSGTTCNDGLFCTRTDTCDGAGTCVGNGDACDDARSCTIDSCDETANRCANVMGRGCIVGGECVGEGTEHPTYPCLYCDPDLDATDWTARAAGTSCSSARCVGGFLYGAGTCSADGFCDAARGMRCPTGACLDATSCEVACTASSCGAGQYCDTTTRRCATFAAPGEGCATDATCASGHCIDGVCCNTACNGTCETCATTGQLGTCAPVRLGTDPAGECGPGRACDGAGGCRAERPDAGAIDAGEARAMDASAVDASTEADAGLDAGLAEDAAVALDAGTPSTGRGGCACRAAPRPGSPNTLSLTAVGVGLVFLSRLVRRRPRR